MNQSGDEHSQKGNRSANHANGWIISSRFYDYNQRCHESNCKKKGNPIIVWSQSFRKISFMRDSLNPPTFIQLIVLPFSEPTFHLFPRVRIKLVTFYRHD